MIRWLLPEGCPDGSRFLLYYRAFIWLISLSSVMTAGHTGCCFRSSNRSHELLQGGHRAVTCSGSGTRIRDTFLTRPLPLRNLSRDVQGRATTIGHRVVLVVTTNQAMAKHQMPPVRVEASPRSFLPDRVFNTSRTRSPISSCVSGASCSPAPLTAHRSLAIARSTWRVQCNLQFASPGNHD